MSKRIHPSAVGTAVATLLAATPVVGLAGDLTANAGITNNYIWRGLTQTRNEPAISGGIDWAAENGFYIGTWASNVEYGDLDPFSYEHDIYFGFSGGEDLTYDIGYLYYNYDSLANWDFGEVYAGIGIGGFAAKLSVLANTERDEPLERDYGFGDAWYLSLDYGIALRDELTLGLHAGRHEGDFAEDFNGVPGAYTDYGISLSKGGFTFGITDTDLDRADDGLDNGSMKFVVGYSIDFDW